MIFVVPKFEKMFSELGAELPNSTKLLIYMSHAVQDYWWILLTALIGGFMFFKNWKNSTEGKAQWDEILLNTPIINKFIKTYSTIQIATNFSTLLNAGIVLSDYVDVSLDTTTETTSGRTTNVLNQELNGLYKVIGVTYSGDTIEGEFVTKLECVSIGSDSSE